MAEEIGFENGRNSNFEGLVTLTLDPAIQHTVVHHSSTSTYIQNFIQIEETFVDGRTDVRTDGRTDIFPPLILLGRLLEVDLKIIFSKQHQHTFRNDVPAQFSLSLHFCDTFFLLNSSDKK